MNVGAPELLIIFAVILVLFGGAKLPKLARSLGQAQSEFKKGLSVGSGDTADRGESTAENEKITLTKAELDALVTERARAAQEQPPSA